jgi:hypothetical protein
MSQGERLILGGLGPHTRQHVLSLLAQCPGLKLTSGRRSVERNRAAGGVSNSWHLQGRAADFTGTAETLEYGLRIVRYDRLGRRCTGPEEALIHDVRSGIHLHVAW